MNTRATLIAAVAAVAVVAAWTVVNDLRQAGTGRTRVEHDVVVERLRAVAELVTSETSVRDVVTYRHTWLGSTKQSLVVVTGRVRAGIDLSNDVNVTVDAPAKRIDVTLPHAKVLAVEITELRTYDERRGLWNPFRPSDRDSIFQVARRRIEGAATELGLVPHAEAGARRVLEGLFRDQGYAVVVTYR